MSLLNIILTALFCYFSFYVLYYFVFALCARLGRSKKHGTNDGIPGSFAVLIPAYKEDSIIINTAVRNLAHNYPAGSFDIIVIADTLQPKTLAELAVLPVKTVEVRFEKSSKGKAINAALQKLDRTYDYVMILDADNVMGPDCLLKMDAALKTGVLAIQGHRTAKNKNNSMAILDSISEEVNNGIFRKGQRVLGLSSALIGSGMAFDFNYYKTLIHQVEDIWEDRELEFRILKDGNVIEYLEDALVYDEKVTDSNVFKNQRSKWIAGQLHYFRKYIFANWNAIFRGNIDLLNKLLQTMSPPRSLLLGGLVIFTVIAFFAEPRLHAGYWGGLFLAFVVALFLAVPVQMLNRQLLKASFKLPMAILMMFLGLFKSILGRNVNFNTPHIEK